MVSANIVANNILVRAFKDKEPVTPMKLQKLLYLVFKKYLQDTHTLLFSDHFATWKYGPVVQSVYDEFKSFHASPINKFSKDSKGDAYIADEESDGNLKNSLDYIWAHYKKYSGIQLSTFTHKPDTAWDKARKSCSPELNVQDILSERPLVGS